MSARLPFSPLVVACLHGFAAVAGAQTFTGYLDVAGTATQLIPITLAKDGRLELSITVGPYLNLNANAAVGVSEGVMVYDSTGTNRLYGAVQPQGSTLTHVVDGLGAGDFVVRLTAIGNFQGLGWGEYTMIVSETPDALENDLEPNDHFEHALLAELDTDAIGHLGYLGPQSVIDKQDYWKVSLPSDGTLQLDIATGERLNLNQNASVGATGGVMVYDSDWTTVFSSSVQGQKTTATHSIPKLKAGVYYVRLVVLGPDRAYYGSYRMTPRHTPESVPNDAEPNDQPAQYGLLALNSQTTGHLGYYGGGSGNTTDVEDWWRLTLPQSGNLQLEVATSPLLNLNANASVGANNGITVYDRDATTILFEASQAQNSTNTHVAHRLKPGIYYVRLTKIDQATYYGGYRLTPRLVAVPEDPEPNDQAADAAAAALGGVVEGNLGFRGGGYGVAQDQLDWWKFTMPSTGQVRLVITTVGNLNLNSNAGVGVSEGITVFEAAPGGGVGARRFGTSQGQGTTNAYPLNLEAGDYYLRLAKLGQDGYWGTYSVAFNYSGPPIINSPATARAFAGRPFRYTITALGGGVFGATDLPMSLLLNPDTGVISGTLGDPGTYNITLLATNSSGVASGSLTLAVLPLPSVSIQAVASDRVAISWSADYHDFTLFTSSGLSQDSIWEESTSIPVALGGVLSVTNQVGPMPRYYRLSRP